MSASSANDVLLRTAPEEATSWAEALAGGIASSETTASPAVRSRDFFDDSAINASVSDSDVELLEDQLRDPSASHVSFRMRMPWAGRRGARDTKRDRLLQEDVDLAAGPVRGSKPADQTYESLDYEFLESRQHAEEDELMSDRFFLIHSFMRWVVVFIIGVMTGVVAFGIDMGVRYLARQKFAWTRALIESNGDFLSPVLAWICLNSSLVLFAALIVVFVEPMAAGSGIPEIKCYLNGVKIQRVVRMKTLFAKAVGVLFSVAGGLAVGKEGPMIHSGAIIGAGVSQGQIANACLRIDSRKLLYFRNDHEKRDFVSAGAAAGVAAAFGAPLGGVLFSLEEGASFWNQSLTWRTFFCAMVSTFTLNLMLSGTTHGAKWGMLSQPGLITFGSFGQNSGHGFTLSEVPLFIAIGAIGGLFGALFNAINLKLTHLRTRWSRSKPLRVLEAVTVAALTAFLLYSIACYFKLCATVPPDMVTTAGSPDTPTKYYKFYCDPGADGVDRYNILATLFFTTEETAIENLFHAPNDRYELLPLAMFFVSVFFLSVITYGIAVPSGLFVPSLLTGAALGRMFGLFLRSVVGWEVDSGTYALLGAAAFLGGVVRMTISLTVILIEATNDIEYGLPIMITIMVAKWIGDIFNEGIYDLHIEFKKVPLLGWFPKRVMRHFAAKDVMKRPVVCLREIENVSRVVQVLQNTTHNGFPVVSLDDHHTFCGLILRRQLIALLDSRIFFPRGKVRTGGTELDAPVLTARRLAQYYPRWPEIDTVMARSLKNPGDLDCKIDLRRYYNVAPYTVSEQCPLDRVFRLFRTMGLRHLVVTDENNAVSGMITRKEILHSMSEHCSHATGRTKTGISNQVFLGETALREPLGRSNFASDGVRAANDILAESDYDA